MGLGDIHIRAMLDGWFGEALVSAANQDRAEILLDTDIAGTDWLTDIWRTRLKRRKGRSSRRLLRENRPKKM